MYKNKKTITFVEVPLAAIKASSFLVYDPTSVAYLYFGEFLPFFSEDPLKLCQFGWGALLHSYFLSWLCA